MPTAIHEDATTQFIPQEYVELGVTYHELERIAERRLCQEPLAYLWTAAELINEAYLRLASGPWDRWAGHKNRAALWSCVMRNVLTDNARSFRAVKRNLGRFQSLADQEIAASPRDLDLEITIRVAVAGVGAGDPRQAKVLRLTIDRGYTLDETAQVMRISSRTAKRLLRAARHQLRVELIKPPLHRR